MFAKSSNEDDDGHDEPHYACQAMLSVYIQGEGAPELDEEQFFDKTFVTIQYRCKSKNERLMAS